MSASCAPLKIPPAAWRLIKARVESHFAVTHRAKQPFQPCIFRIPQPDHFSPLPPLIWPLASSRQAWTLPVIRSWMGHAHLDTTNLYAQANLETKRQALNQLDREPDQGSILAGNKMTF